MGGIYKGTIIFLLLAVIAIVENAATNKPTTPQVPKTTDKDERETYSFLYHGNSHELYAKIDVRINGHLSRKCYIVKLSDQERQAVHTDFGMRVLELKALAQRNTAVEVNVTEIRDVEKRVCGRSSSCRYFRIQSI